MVNPYAVNSSTGAEQGIYGDFVRRLEGSFLYRVLEFEHPEPMRLRYSGWWWVQRVWLDDELVWWQVSWRSIRPLIEITLPERLSHLGETCRIEIDFNRALWIRRFRVWFGDSLAYDEVNS